jgi:hypothetical protein
MYNFKHAVRVEADNNWTKQLSAILQEPLPARVTCSGINELGKWYTIQLPASVWALAVTSDRGIMVGLYHSPAMLEIELKEALNGSQEKAKVSN